MKIKKIIYKYNSLGFKVKISLAIVSIIPLFIYLFLNNHFMTHNFLTMERKQMEISTKQAVSILNSKEKDIAKLTADYALWDDTYERILDKDYAWLSENFSEWIPEAYDIDLLIISDRNKKIVDSYGVYDIENCELFADKTISLVFEGKYDNMDGKCPYGLKNYNNELYLLTVCPIMPYTYDNTSEGLVIIGKKVTNDFLDSINTDYGFDISITTDKQIISKNMYPSIIKRYINEIKQNETEMFTHVEKSNIIGGQPLQDISGQNIGYMFVNNSRNIFLSTIKLNNSTGIVVLLISIITIFFLSIQLKAIIINPIRNLDTQIDAMVAKSKLECVNVEGSDEIASLAQTFNQMAISIETHKNENENLKALSITDGLTSLYNHRYFYEYFNSRISICTNMTILFCDIDHFKVINDTNGHMTGDIVLREVSNIIRAITHGKATVFRYGGEEIIILMENNTPNQAYATAEEIRTKVYNSKELQSYSSYLPITISIGLAAYPIDGTNVKTVVEKADKAMYYAKQNGRNQCCIYVATLEDLLDKNSLEYARNEALTNSVYSLVAAIDAKDAYTERHSESVVRYSLILAEKLNMSEREKYALQIGGLLHDCGKIGIPDHIINKTETLSNDEWETIKNHTLLGSNIIKYIIKTPEIESCIKYHHEKWDGTGYPEGLKGSEIPYFARITCIADAYHAMVSDRPYRKALTHEEAVKELSKNKGTQFDPELVDSFINALNECKESEEKK